MLLTQTRLKELLSYDPETGIFTWVKTVSNRAPAGKTAGADGHGYRDIRLYGRLYKAHRLAWLYMTGDWPLDQIDHINGTRSDNRWVNLRAATLTENNRNIGTQVNSTTGYKGVSKHGSNYRAECYADGHRIRKSGFLTPEAAHAWLNPQRSKLHGEFANHGMNL